MAQTDGGARGVSGPGPGWPVIVVLVALAVAIALGLFGLIAQSS